MLFCVQGQASISVTMNLIMTYIKTLGMHLPGSSMSDSRGSRLELRKIRTAHSQCKVRMCLIDF